MFSGVPGRTVTKYYLCPPVRDMTIVALLLGDEMVAGFSCRLCSVMAGIAAAEYRAVIDAYYWLPSDGGMTVLTEIGAVDMLSVLASGGGAVVAGHAVAADIGMLEDGR